MSPTASTPEKSTSPTGSSRELGDSTSRGSAKNPLRGSDGNQSRNSSGIAPGDLSGNPAGDLSGITPGDSSGNPAGELSGITPGDSSRNPSGDLSGITPGDSSRNPSGDPTRGPARCPFCAPAAPKIIEHRLAFSIPDAYPVSKGHTLVIPRRHVAGYFLMQPEEKSACWELVEWVRQYLMDRYQPSGINVGFNCGCSAGQTIFHAHIHVIPRFDGDTPNPRGGVRHCIPGKGDY